MDNQMWLVEYPSFYGTKTQWMSFESIEVWRSFDIVFVVIGASA